MFSGFGGFGGGGKKDEESSIPAPAEKETKPSKEKAPSGSAKSIHGFDPAALERAAKAAKELDSSKNARDALRLVSTQEATKQKEHEMERAKYQAMQQELAIKRVREEEEAGARTLDRQTQHERARSEYKDQLERKRMIDQINAQRQISEEERSKSEESLKRQEEIKRTTLEYEHELKYQKTMARVKAERDGRIMQERQNHDLEIDRRREEGSETRKTILVQSKENRDTLLESIKLAGSTFGNGFTELLNDKQQLTNAAGTITLVALGIYGSKASIGVTRRYVEARIGKPNLVRETSKQNIIQMAKAPFSTFKLAFGTGKGKSSILGNVMN
jgi:ATPase family AAA domain-containing protein 3A/B